MLNPKGHLLLRALCLNLFTVLQRIKEKWNMPLHNWALIISQLDIYFPGRIKIELSLEVGADTVR